MATYSDGKLRVPKFFSDGMVLQRQTPVKIWGWGPPDSHIQVKFRNDTYPGIVDAEGNWSIQLAPMEAGGPYSLEISITDSPAHCLPPQAILLDDVWRRVDRRSMVVFRAIQHGVAPYACTR